MNGSGPGCGKEAATSGSESDISTCTFDRPGCGKEAARSESESDISTFTFDLEGP